MTALTDLEIAVNAGRTIQLALEADGRLRFLSESACETAVIIQKYFADRVLELKAAEKKAERPPTDLDKRFGRVTDRLSHLLTIVELVNAKIAHLENRVENHVHNMELTQCPGCKEIQITSIPCNE